jgi:3-oxoacyl-[acyl-carrier-protein] synthase II
MREFARKCVVTGMGCVTPLGEDLAQTWRRLVAGEDAQGPVGLFDVSGCRCRQAAVATLPALDWLEPKRARRLSRGARLLLPAAREAMQQARLLGEDGRSRLPWLPVSVSTTAGGMELGETFFRALRAGPAGARAGRGQFIRVARYQAQQQALELQLTLGARGPVTIIANACSSGANSVGHAADLVWSGQAECVLAGGYEPLAELIYIGFDCLQALTTERCRPFDRARSGLMLGEAAAFLVLESEPHARARGATVLCELAGYGHATDLHHLTQPQPAGATLSRVMREALAQAGLAASQIGYLNAHGTATPLNDASECAAFQAVFGEGSPVTRISSTKAAIGHTLGAAGSVETVFCAQALLTGQLPPQINLQQPEPAVAERLVAPGERIASLSAVMNVNLGFGGTNAALVLRRPEKAPTPGATAVSPRQMPLGIAGMGAVSPAGLGVEALLGSEEMSPQTMVSYAGRKCAVCRVDMNDERLKRAQLQPRLRRASPIAVFMLEAARQALAQAGQVDVATLGIVAAFCTGPVVSTRRFYEGGLKNGARFASPNVFPETVYNSATSHVAAVLGASGPSYSVLGDDSAWVNAISIAHTWLATGTVESALVVGAEELDPVLLDAYIAARWMRRGARFVPGEGAGALLLRRAGDDTQAVRVTRWADGFVYRNRSQARSAAAECLSRFEDAAWVFPGAQHNWLGPIEAEVLAERRWRTAPARPYCGEAFAASAAWQTIRALAQARACRQRVLVPVWGLNQQCSALLLEPVEVKSGHARSDGG